MLYKPKKIVTIFGGTGFLGKHVVRILASKGYGIKVASRYPESAYHLKTTGHVGQIIAVYCDYSDPDSYNDIIKGSDAVINCIGILSEKRKNDFAFVHSAIPEMIAKSCAKFKVGKFIHVSALGCDKAGSKYAKTKFEGEKLISKIETSKIIIRPSVMFGHDDRFFNLFAFISSLSPIIPLIGKGETRFQPVFAGDVAHAIVKLIESEEDNTNNIYEITGNEIVTLKNIYKKVLQHKNKKRIIVKLPFPFAKLIALPLSLFPNPLLTADQVESLKTDNIGTGEFPRLKELGIIPKTIDCILPEYL